MTVLRVIWLAGFCVLAAGLVPGCDKDPDAEDADETIVIGNVEISADGGIHHDCTIPGDFPSDVPLADYMACRAVTDGGSAYNVILHAIDTPFPEVVAWFKTGMGENGWRLDASALEKPPNAILPFTKNGRNCGVSITNFVFDGSMQRDESPCGVTILTPKQ